MADNPYAQFDQQPSEKNPYEQFDAKSSRFVGPPVPDSEPGPFGMKLPLGGQDAIRNQARSIGAQGVALYQGVTNFTDMPADWLINVYNLGNRMFSKNPQNVPTVSQSRDAALEAIGAPKPVGAAEDVAAAATRAIGGGLPTLGYGAVASSAPGLLGSVGRTLVAQPTTQLASAATGGASSDIARQMGAGPLGQTAAGIAGGFVPIGISAIRQSMAPNPNVPTSDVIKNVAAAKYDKLANSNISFSTQDVQSMGKEMGSALQEFGLTSVQDVKDLFPKLGKAIGRIEDAIDGQQPVSFTDISNIRKLIKLGAASQDKSERALSMALTEKLDDMVTQATSIPNEARDLWRRASNAEMIDRLAQRADDSSSQFTSSGLENAIRTQFRQFTKNDRQMRMLRPAEQDAMRTVAQGTLSGNILRALGRFAPRGPVSVGVDTLLGGGPVGSMAMATLGESGRLGATASTARNMQLAREIMLSGGQQIPPPPIQWPIYGPLASLTGNSPAP